MLVLFSAAVFLSAALLFLVEPMFARMILPRLGGAPAVWNTCMVFYQSALFAGYAYAHLVTKLQPRLQAVSQMVWLVAGVMALPIAVGASWAPPPTANPIGWVFLLLLAAVGLPFFVVATTGPLLQHWFGRLGHRASGNPYLLYSASNLGSLLALLAYPAIVEPALRLQTQSALWTALYVALVVVIGACAAAVWRLPAEGGAAPADAGTARARHSADIRAKHVLAGAASANDPPLSEEREDWWAARVSWLCLALIPSTLMLSVTTFISTDVAAVPLLWIAPLSIYLITFIVAFADRQWIAPRLLDHVFPVAAIIVVALVLAPNGLPIPLMVSAHLLCFFVIALTCHQRLAQSRPPGARLTEFYLWVAGGGAIGGVFNTLVAPQLFVNALEYPLAAVSTCLLLPWTAVAPAATNARRVASAAAIVMPAALLWAMIVLLHRMETQIPDTVGVRYAFVYLLPLLACFVLRTRPLLMGLALAAVLVEGSFVRFDDRVPLFIERTFYGEHRVMFTGAERVLTSGTTNHGAQSVRRQLACEPLTYYSRRGPVGQLFDSLRGAPAKTRFAVVGLGTGSIGAYAAPQQTWTFFEINPAIERIARNPDYFTYLKDCAPQATVVIGDARLALERVADGSFDVLFVDAFTSDAIPVHLLTTEAMQLYMRKLSPTGLVAVHISNRYLQLTPVVASLAHATNLVGVVQVHAPSDEELAISREITTSRWAVLARQRADLGALATDGRWESLDGIDGPQWTDDYSNIVETIRW